MRYPFVTRYKTCIYYNGYNIWGGWGYCDLYNATTGEVWELKRVTCSYDKAVAQLNKYVKGRLKDFKSIKLKKGGMSIGEGAFNVDLGDKTYYVWYWNEGGGIIYYDYTPQYKKESIATGVVTVLVVAGAIVLIPATGGASSFFAFLLI